MPSYRPPSKEVLSALETAPNMYLVLSPDLHILTASNLFLKAVATTRQTIIGKHIFEAFPENPDWAGANGMENINASLQKVLRTKQPHYMNIQKYDVPDRNNPGKFIERYWDPSHTPVLDKQGNIQYIIQLATNVTDKVLTEQALFNSAAEQEESLSQVQILNEELFVSNEELQSTVEELQQLQENLRLLNDELEQKVLSRTKALSESEARLRMIFEQAPLALSILSGPHQVIELVNNQLLRVWGKDESVLGKPYALARPEPAVAPYLKILAEVYSTGLPFSATEEKVFINHAQNYRWGYFNFTYQPIKDEQGKVSAILTIADDVTEKVLARMENDRVNRQLKLAVEAAKIGSWHINPITKRLEYSAALARIFGYEGEEPMTYEQAIAQVTDEYREPMVEAIEKAISTGGDYEFVYSQRRFNDGRIIWLRSLGKVSADEKGEYSVFTGVVIDVTEQVESNNAIRKLNANLSAANAELSAANNEHARINRELQIAQENYIAIYNDLNKSQDDLLFTIDAAGIATWDYNPITGTLGGNDLLKSWFGLEPHDEIDLEKATSVIEINDRESVGNAIQEALKFSSGGKYDIEYTIINPNQPIPRIVRAKGKALFNEQQQAIRLSGTLQDITEQKQDELRKNDFISMVSHELKTPLTSLNAYLQLMQKNAQRSEDQFALGTLDKSVNQVKKMTSMINGFLNVSRLESGKIHIDKQLFDMATLVKEAEEEVMSTINSHHFVFEPVVTTYVKADRDKIVQVLQNFISNAVKYSPIGSTIQVACIKKNGNTEVCVKDEGMGVVPEDQSKLFDRYYRVKSNVNIAGFGIGLYLSAEIIQRHEGKIWVESEVGQGSTFYFSLPLAVA